MSEDAGTEPRTVSDFGIGSQTLLTTYFVDLFQNRLDLVRIRLDLIHIRLDLVPSRLDLIHYLQMAGRSCSTASY